MLIEDLCFQFLKVTELAAVEAYKFAGKSDEKGADRAAVDAMRSTLNTMAIDGEIVIGEGERDNAPMLYIGERVGKGGPALDIAVDPLEGTTTCALHKDGAMSVIAVAKKGSLLKAPDVYMDRIAVGPGLPAGIVTMDNDLKTNLQNLSVAKKRAMTDLVAVVLKRDRHLSLISELRSLGVRVRLIDDGDIGAVISLIKGENDICLGIGGATEGVLSAVALSAVGGQICGRLVLNTAELRDRAGKLGISDYDREYTERDMVRDRAFMIVTGVTGSTLMNGIGYNGHNQLETDSMLFLPEGVITHVRRTHVGM
ncbi:Fructose-1,6-bisphosphatase class 2 [Anaplasma phagocytophilum]|uniref:Fructose-1,6-bisphosphatase n=1 Tax=Anaplasma phagocytophilum TaxID=948 RepID=A0AA45US52_ANAPH|nr:class II fructose-bisphosphatase [Anaplasma phagocytophilum]SBO13849.1 Fructose-1,6-bisphosphatase class 2 [Anaplasma phagocytophilum]SBO32695.1 Fructose-1,6-bisphosphatase class 2 [Anaplasma phagocytophilum]SBO33287.1 Fructose-1,6-bisphosphatase class 2 [Anaplasma phagocytophilum]SBO33387.1 Fructose-1,6-bisphosphatase class 2 [Anaplasma phagocytophilum]SCV64665.1 Fructose-1,6-bisphosphatase class 2 [Anaplasma phagocytophilum]